MSDDDAKVIESLGILALALWRDDWEDATRTAKNALTLIERLAADNASLQAQNRRLRKVGQWYAEKHSKARFEANRLTAEVERLTPKPMTHAEVCGLLNKHRWLASRRVGDDLTWRVDRFGRFVNCPLDDSGRPRSDSDVLEFQEAAWIAQSLLRDADPTSTRSEAT